MCLKKEMIIESEMPLCRDGVSEKIKDYWNVYTSNDVHKKVFDENVKDNAKYPWKRRIIKITSKETGLSVYRIWRGTPPYIKSKNILFIDDTAKYSLINDKENNKVEITLSKGQWYKFYWYHFDNATRISFKLGLLSVILGFISFILGVWSICISCME